MAALKAPAEYFVDNNFFIFVAAFYWMVNEAVKKLYFIILLTALQMYIRFVSESYPLINKRFGTVFAQVAI